MIRSFLAQSAGTVINKSLNQPGVNSNTLTSKTLPHITNALLYFVGAIAIVMIVVGGLRYVLSTGSPAGTKSAKDTILYASVGLVLAGAAYVIVNFVLSHFHV